MSRTDVLPPNAVTMVSSIRSLGYTFETALADVIDNSIAAGASVVDIETEEDRARPLYLAIIDNGCGMSPETLRNAMQYACNNPNAARNTDDLGRFGLGLKTASQSQCKKLTVLTKAGGVVSAAEWDLDTIQSTGDWTLLIYDEHDLPNLPCYERIAEAEHGTAVIWRGFDQLKVKELDLYDALFEKLAQAREHLELIFHRYLAEENIRMAINGRKLIPKDPFLANRSRTTPVETIELPGIEGKIRVIGYTLPHQSRLSSDEILSLGISGRNMEDDQGFYLYRNKRLIFWGSWLRMTRKARETKLSRVQVDLPNTMDHLWELDIRKSQAYPPKIVRERLSGLLSRICEDSERIIRPRGRQSRSGGASEESFWTPKDIGNHRFSVTVNRNSSVFKSFCDSLSDAQQKTFLAYVAWLEASYPIRWVNEQFSGDVSPEITDDKNEEFREKLKNELRMLLSILDDTSDTERVLNILNGISPIPSNRRLGLEIVEELIKELKND